MIETLTHNDTLKNEFIKSEMTKVSNLSETTRKNDEKAASANSVENQLTSNTIDNWLDDLITD